MYEHCEIIKDGNIVHTFYDGEQLYFKLIDIDRVYVGNLERYTDNITYIEPSDVVKRQVKTKTRVISETAIQELDIMLSCLDQNIRGETIQKKIKRVTDFVKYAKQNFAGTVKRKCTDRTMCMKCRYAYFISTGRAAKPSFQWCNYLEMTGQRRPHNKYECYGFEER